MLKVVIGLLVSVMVTSAFAQRDVYVNGYNRDSGAYGKVYVEGYHRTAPDSSLMNNYSTKGNDNPFTGRPGTVNPAPSYSGSTFGSGVNTFSDQSHKKSAW